MSTPRWSLKAFEELSPGELYAILQLRNEVFVVEQKCAYQDLDNKDQHSHHFMAWQQHNLVAYTRIVRPGISYREVSIGRVVTSPIVRRTGMGKELMQKTINEIKTLYGETPIRIGAQVYLISFYSEFGFTVQGEIYDEDGIDHIEMVKS